jgi:hypothetical protein
MWVDVGGCGGVGVGGCGWRGDKEKTLTLTLRKSFVLYFEEKT